MKGWTDEEIEKLPDNIRSQIDSAPPGASKRPPRRLEQELQIAIITLVDQTNFPEDIWRLHRWLMPPVKLGEFIHHTPNGGGRSKAEGGILKAMGVRAGYPDLSFDLAIIDGDVFYPGHRCELKTDNGKLSPNQVIRIETLRRAGYMVDVARSIDEYLSQIHAYLALGKPLYRGVYP